MFRIETLALSMSLVAMACAAHEPTKTSLERAHSPASAPTPRSSRVPQAELQAYRAYGTALDGTEQGYDTERLTEIIAKYPDTYGAALASAALETAEVSALLRGGPSPAVVTFLQDEASDADARSRVRQTLLGALRRRGCKELLPYCSWWIEHYPDAPQTPMLEGEVERIWRERAHPSWRGKRFANCAYRCANRCRAQTGLDDSCYPGCMEGCDPVNR